MKIEARHSFIKDMKNVPTELKERIANIVKLIEQAPDLSHLTQVKKLRGYESFYRIQVGHYRLGFMAEEDVITLVRFLHRREIYRFFP